MVSPSSAVIGEEEAELYDRQIRLWGLEAQNRLRNASVLVVGLGGLGAEVAKNLVLSGLKALVLMDDQKLSAADSEAQFLAPTTSLGENRAEASLARTQELNPMVAVSADPRGVAAVDAQMVSGFALVAVLGQPAAEVGRVDDLCRAAGVPFCAGDVRGCFAFAFADFGRHEFADETVVKSDSASEENGVTLDERGDGEPAAKKNKAADDATTVVKAVTEFSSFAELRGVDWGLKRNVGRGKRLPPTYAIFAGLWDLEGTAEEKEKAALAASWAKVAAATKCKAVAEGTAEALVGALSPVCAIVGGVMAQEAIKAVSRKDRPYNNVFFYDGTTTSGVVAQIPPASSS